MSDHDQMQHLFDEALDTGPARATIDRLVYCHVLTRLTDGDQQLAAQMFSTDGAAEAANRELEDLDDHGRDQLAAVVCPAFNAALSLAVNYMFRACRQLGYDPAGLGPDHLAILASVFIAPEFTHLERRLADNTPRPQG